MISKKYLCSNLWNHLVVDFRTHQYRLCCKTGPSQATTSELREFGQGLFLNADKIVQARIEMLSGERPQICSQCWELEKQNLPSSRGTFEDWQANVQMTNFPHANLETAQPAELATSKFPKNLDIQVGNTCDLKCVYCNDKFSTAWLAENKRFGNPWYEPNMSHLIPEDQDTQQLFEKNFWELFEETKYSFERIAILGGEPLVSSNFYEILSQIINRFERPSPKLELNIITNLNTTEFHFNKFLTLLPQLSQKVSVVINISMEAWGPQAEYIRHGLNFQRFLQNFEKLLALDLNLKFITINTVNILALSTFEQYIRWLRQQELRFNKKIEAHVNTLAFPEFLSVGIATPQMSHFLTPLIHYLENEVLPAPDSRRWSVFYQKIKQVHTQLQSVEITPHKEFLRKEFHRFIQDIETRRSLKFSKVFPDPAYQTLLPKPENFELLGV